MSIPLLLLVGPTASGKTDVAVPLAQAVNAEIISADSMQVYRGMDIGTAKPGPQTRAVVPHHLVDICDPWETFNTAMFVAQAGQKIHETTGRGRKVMLVGGTALYLKSLLEGIFPGPPANWEIRDDLTQRPLDALYEELCRVDPQAAHKISPQDRRRMVRALEIFYLTGTPISLYQKQHTQRSGDYQPVFIGIRRERPLLYRRIEKRVDEMLQKGLVEETQRLLALPYPLSHTASQAIGYKEVIAALQERELLKALPETITRNTKLFAKRQMTWLRRFPVHWLPANVDTTVPELVGQAYQVWHEKLT